MDFEKTKNKIFYRLVNRKKSPYNLDEIAHTDFLDLAFVYLYVKDINSCSIDFSVIENDYLDKWGVTDLDLYKLARLNFPLLFSLKIFGREFGENIIMVTTRYNLFGAVYMSDKFICERLCDIVDDDLCIIPSSTHEIIAAPASYLERDFVDNIIKEVNKSSVGPDEYLSDHMYMYLRETGEIIY